MIPLKSPVYALAISPNALFVAVQGMRIPTMGTVRSDGLLPGLDKSLSVYSISTGQLHFKLVQQPNPLTVGWLSHGKSLGLVCGYQDGNIVILEGRRSVVGDVSLPICSQWLAMTYSQKCVSFEHDGLFRAHDTALHCLLVHPSRRFIGTISGNVCRVWKVTVDCKPLSTLSVRA